MNCSRATTRTPRPRRKHQDGWLQHGRRSARRRGQLKRWTASKDIASHGRWQNLTPSEIENTMKGSPYIAECVIVAEGRKVLVNAGHDRPLRNKWANGPGAHAAPAVHVISALVGMPQVCRPHRRRHPHRQRAPGPGLADPQIPPAHRGAGPRRRRSHRHHEGALLEHLTRPTPKRSRLCCRQRSALSKQELRLMALILKSKISQINTAKRYQL